MSEQTDAQLAEIKLLDTPHADFTQQLREEAVVWSIRGYHVLARYLATAAQRLEARREISDATVERGIRGSCDAYDPGPCRYPGCDCKALPKLVRAALEAASDQTKDQLALKDIYLIATATAQDFALLERWWVESRRGSNANRAYKNLVERVREIAKIAGKESTP